MHSPRRLLAEQVFKILDRAPVGRFRIHTPDGATREFGRGNNDRVAVMEVKDWRVFSDFLQSGEIGLTETYRDGLWSTPDLTALLRLGLENMQALAPVVRGNLLTRLVSRVQYWLRANTPAGSRRNIQAHYDLGNSFYALWLDPSMTYSSALFSNADQDLLTAQHAKYDRLLGALEKDRGSLLEIGCGWGGFAERALNQGDYHYQGLTLSDAQHAYAKDRLGGNGEVLLRDYRTQDGKYSNIVSIEMFEAVGERYWPLYFSKLKSLLDEKGKAMVQTITIREESFDSYRTRGDMIRTFIFPGGMLPSAPRFQAAAEKAGLQVNEIFEFGQDYARTLQIWLQNFEASLDQIVQMGFDEAFIRVWRFYLCACIAAFQTGNTNVMQVELVHA